MVAFRRRFLILITILLTGSNVASAQSLCQYTRGANKYYLISVRSDGTCPNQSLRLVQMSGQRIWGNNSRGNFTAVAGNVYEFEDQNFQFGDFTVQNRATVIFTSGSRILTTGRFLNNGTISVKFGAGAGERLPNSKSGLRETANRPSHPGAGSWCAMAGEIGSYDSAAGGSSPEPSLPGGEVVFRPGPFGGGGGAAGFGRGGRGGGSLLISSGSSFENNGVIEANGEDAPDVGAGGGAGGIIVISSLAYTNSASINARGGAGGNGRVDVTYAVAPGGGGAGGIVHIIAPVATINQVAPSVDGGIGGFTQDQAAGNALIMFGGGAGGSFFSSGGAGGAIVSSTISGGGAQSIGQAGTVLRTVARPDSLFLTR